MIPPDERKDLLSDFKINNEMAKNFQDNANNDLTVSEPLKKNPISELGDRGAPTAPKIIREKSDSKSSVSPSKVLALKTSKKGVLSLYPKDFPPFYKDLDASSPEVWNVFRPKVYRGEKLTYEVKYFGVICGTMELSSLGLSKVGKKTAFHFYARGLSADFYEYFYKLDDYVETFVDVKDFTPLKYTLVQRESGQNVDDLQLFDFNKLKSFMWFKRIKKKDKSVTQREESKYMPRLVVDSFAVLYFIRGLPLFVGAKYKVPVITRVDTWLLTVEVVAKEELNLDKVGKQMAFKIKAETHFPGVLKKRGDVFFWFADDEFSTPLKFEGKVKIGSVEGELIKHIEGNLIENID